MTTAMKKRQKRRLLATERRGKDMTGIGRELHKKQTKLLEEDLFDMAFEDSFFNASLEDLQLA